MASFNPIDSFAVYDKANLVKLAQFYPDDFSRYEMDHLLCQLQLFMTDMRGDERFRKVKSLAELSIMLVETKKHTKYLNDCLVTFIEREFFLQVKDNDIINRYQSMSDRKVKMKM
jgi:hypothetical protein